MSVMIFYGIMAVLEVKYLYSSKIKFKSRQRRLAVCVGY